MEDEMTFRPHTKLYLVHLKLSSTPPTTWTRFFDQSRKEPRHPLWRNAVIDRKTIAVECVPEELETHLLAALKEDVAFANARYREFLKKELDEEMAIRGGTKSRTSQKITDLRGKLKFD
jgi:hypothetical protein